MPIAKTVTGKPFEYSGSLETGLTVFFKAPHKKLIPVQIIKVIRQEITKRSPVLMGANRSTSGCKFDWRDSGRATQRISTSNELRPATPDHRGILHGYQ